MALTQQERRDHAVLKIADGVALATKHSVDMDWQCTRTNQTFERFLLDRAAGRRISRLIGLPLWFSRFTAEELAAQVQMRLQAMLDGDSKTQQFLRVTAGIKRFGPIKFTFWTVEAGQ